MGYDPFFSESPTGVLVLDHAGRILDVNPVGCEAFARPLDRLKGTEFLEWVHPSDQGLVKRKIQKVVHGETLEWRSRIRRGDGLPRLQSYRGVPLAQEGEPGSLALFLRGTSDTDLGRPEIPQLLDLVRTLPGQFILTTDKAGKIRHSAGLERTHFLNSSAALGLSYKELVGGEREGEESFDELLQEVTAGRPWAGLQWHRRVDGPSFPARIFAGPHRDPKAGQIVGMIVIGIDDTEAHRWRDRAERAEPLAQIGSLSTGIAQKTSAALSRLEEIVSEIPASAPEARMEADTVRSEISHFNRFLEAVAEFGNRGTLRRRTFPIVEAVSESLERLESRFGSCGVEPSVVAADDLPKVYADQAYLVRILEILLENALDVMAGTEDPFLRLELTNAAEGVLLRITNSSPQMPPEWLAELFDPFFTTRQGRPGLGLAVAQGMVRAHDGHLWAEIPEPGLLRLSLELPKEAPDRVRDFRAVPLDLSRARRVLLVDGQEARRTNTRSFLEKLGYDVQEAWSARGAVAEITNGKLPEIVVTDLKLSDGSGAWFLGELDRQAPRLVPRTILLTADPDFEAAGQLADDHGCSVVRKPVEPTELLEVLDTVSSVV